jgi:hypothetical protein
MKKRFSPFKGIAASFAIASLLCLPAITHATPVTLTLDSSQSYLNMSGNAFTLSYGPQAEGSMTAFYGGTIAADLTAGVFTFTGGSSIVGMNNPAGPFVTSPFPGGPYPGNYGVTASGFVTGIGAAIINGDLTGVSLDLATGTAQNGLAPSGMTDLWTAGSLIWGALTDLGPFGDNASMAGIYGSDTSAALVSWNGTQLILPITFHTTGANRYEDWSGQLVANISEVPEPSTLALAGMGLLGLLGLQFSRSRRSN